MIPDSIQAQLKERPNAPLLSVSLDEESGNSLISIEVPAGIERPYVYNGAVYIRQGLRTIPADATTLRDMVQSAGIATQPWGKRISAAMESKDLDSGEIEQTVADTNKSGRLMFSEPDDQLAVLGQLGLAQSARFTQTCDVLFSSAPAMRHPQIRMRATCFAEDKDSSVFIDDKSFEGPLVHILGLAEKFILRNMRTSVSFPQKGMQTNDLAEYPKDAIREGLVNALAHRDYAAFHGGIAIRIYPTRLEIWNSGHLPAPLKPSDLRGSHSSIPVNPDIAQTLYIRGFMNRIGRGTQRIVNACLENGMRKPDWKDDSTGVTLTLYAQNHGDNKKGGFTDRQVALLQDLRTDDEISPRAYRKHFALDITERQARRDIKELEDIGLVERVGRGAATHYRRTQREWISENRT